MNLKKLSRTALAPLALAGLLTVSIAPTAVFADFNMSTIDDHECSNTEWHFVITNYTGGQPYPTITVTWQGGAKATLSVDQVSPAGGDGKVTLHYRTDANLNLKVTGATTTAASSSYGNFNLSHGPCGPAANIPFSPAFAYPAVGALSFAAAYGVRRIRNAKREA